MNEAASSIYTKTGDDGTTGRLFGGRLAKDDLVIEACGDVDEAVAALGLARAALGADAELAGMVLAAQRQLFVVAVDLRANPRARNRLTPGVSQVGPDMIDDLERTIDTLVAERPLRPVFIVPGATGASSAIDVARAVIRRAERHVLGAQRAGHAVSAQVTIFLNRVSDLLYVLARRAAGAAEEAPSHG